MQVAPPLITPPSSTTQFGEVRYNTFAKYSFRAHRAVMGDPKNGFLRYFSDWPTPPPSSTINIWHLLVVLIWLQGKKRLRDEFPN